MRNRAATKRFYQLIILIALSAFVGCQSYTETIVTVRDVNTSLPISAAQVNIEMTDETFAYNKTPLKQSASTDSKGKARFELPLKRVGFFDVTHPDYNTIRGKIEADTLSDGQLDVKMKRSYGSE